MQNTDNYLRPARCIAYVRLKFRREETWKVQTCTHSLELKTSKLETSVKAILSQSIFGFPFHVKAEIITIFDCLLKAIQNTTISCKFGRSKAKANKHSNYANRLDTANAIVESTRFLCSLGLILSWF